MTHYTSTLPKITPDSLILGLVKGEAQNRMPTREGKRRLRRPDRGQTVSTVLGVQKVVGGGMASSRGDVNQGSRSGESHGVHGLVPEEPCPEGDRASVGAKKRGNARGAKPFRQAQGPEHVEGGRQGRGSRRAENQPATE